MVRAEPFQLLLRTVTALVLDPSPRLRADEESILHAYHPTFLDFCIIRTFYCRFQLIFRLQCEESLN